MQLEAVVKDNSGVLSHHLAKHKRIKTEKKKKTQIPVFSQKGERSEEIASKEVSGPWSQGFSFTQLYEERKV